MLPARLILRRLAVAASTTAPSNVSTCSVLPKNLTHVKYLSTSVKLRNNENHDEFTQKAEEQKAKEANDTKEADDDEAVRGKILTSSLQFVPAYGWTREAVEAGTESLGYPPVTSGIVKQADIELIHHHSKTANGALEVSMKAEAQDLKESLKVTPFIRRNVEKRLRLNAPYLSRWSDAMVIMGYPQNAPQSLHLSLELMDSMWHHAGCKSTDYNWYTKRLSLLAVYKSTELAMMNDKSQDFAETWAFLDRRLGDQKNLSDMLLSPEDMGKVAGALGTTLQAFLGMKR